MSALTRDEREAFSHRQAMAHHVCADKAAWMDEHYPRCVRCSLRTYVDNFTGRRCDEVTGTAGCPASLLPIGERPDYPYIGSAHVIAAEVTA